MKQSVLFFGACLFCATNAFAQNQNATLVIPIGHTNGITAVDVSPDGRYWLTGSLDKTVKIWDNSGLELRTLVGHNKDVLAVAFSPKTATDPEGGQYILSGGSDRKAILWDLTGKKIAEFSEPGALGDVNAVAFSPDGNTLLIGLKDGTARLLDRSCVEIRRFKHKDELNSVAFSPDGTHILTACKDKTATVWKTTDNTRPLRKLSDHSGPVSCAVYSSTGDTLLTGSSDGTAILWKLNGSKIRTFQHGAEVQQVALSSASGDLKVATGAIDGTLKFWGLTDNEAKPVKCFRRKLSALKFSTDGQLAIAASDAENAAKITTISGKAQGQLKGHTSAITALSLSPDGNLLLVAHADSTAKLWDLSDQKVVTTRYPDRLGSVAFSPKQEQDTLGGEYLLIGCEDRFCRITNVRDSTESRFPKSNRGVFSPDGKYVLTGNSDGTTQLWDIATQTPQALPHSLRRVTALAYSPLENASDFAIGSRDGELLYWASKTAVPIPIKLSSNSEIESMAFSSDGKKIACGISGGLTDIVDIEGKKVIQTIRPRRLGSVRAVAFFPKTGEKDDPRLVRSAGSNVEIINTETHEQTVLSGHVSDVTALALSPNGTQIYSGSQDGTIRIWDVGSKKEIATLVALGTSNWAVTTPQGLYDASPEAMKIMHYVAGMDVVLLRQIKERYLDPGLLAKVTGFSNEDIRDVPNLDAVALYPEVHAKIVGNKLEISLVEKNGGLGRLSFYINGKRVESDLNPARLNKLTPIDLDLDKYTLHYRADTANTIGLVAYNSGNWLRSQAIEMPYRPIGSRGGANSNSSNAAPSDCKSTKPSLYIISVGTSKYLDESKNLAFPDKDAADMANALSSVGRAMFGNNVYLKHLSTAGDGVELATKENIKKAFEDFGKKATPCDVLVSYFSGHGQTWGSDGVKQNFYYLTREISSDRLRDDAIRKAHAISDVELEDWLNGVHAQKQVLIIDACNSGKAADNINIGQKTLNSTQAFAMDILNDRTGALIITGSLADMLSYEASRFGQGLLTYSLLRGMTGPGLLHGKVVDVMTLFLHARSEVPKLAESIKQKQTPVIASGGDSFPIGIKDESVVISLAEEKPVFVQSKFINMSGFFKDTLGGIGLGQALNDYFFEQRLKGPAAKYVYYDTQSLPDGYSVQGGYTIVGDKLIIKGNLFKGSTPVGEPFDLESSPVLKAASNAVLKAVLPRVK